MIATREQSLKAIVAANSIRSLRIVRLDEIRALPYREALDRLADLIEARDLAIGSARLYYAILNVRRMGNRNVIKIAQGLRPDLMREIMWLYCRELTDRECRLVAGELRRTSRSRA